MLVTLWLVTLAGSSLQAGTHIVSRKPRKLPMATKMARMAGDATQRQRRYVMAYPTTSPLAAIRKQHCDETTIDRYRALLITSTALLRSDV